MFNQFGSMNVNGLMSSMGGAMNMMQQFNQFRQQLQGNPQQQSQQAQFIIQNALNSGQMNQNQFSQLLQMAQQLSRYMPR